jgi:hypothetical protein
VQVVTASNPEWIYPFSGLRPARFRRLVRLVAQRGGDTIADGRPGRQWALPLADRVLVAAYWRTNLTMRQLGPLFGVSHSTAHRVIETLGPLHAPAPARRRPRDQIAIVDGTLVPARDRRLAAPSKNYLRLARSTRKEGRIATRPTCRSPSTPTPAWSSPWASRNRNRNRNDTIVYRASGIADTLAGRPVVADGGYRGNPEVIIPYRQPADGSELPAWKQRLNAEHRTIRARIEHTFARMKCWKVLRDYRRAAHTLAASGIAHLHNIARTR